MGGKMLLMNHGFIGLLMNHGFIGLALSDVIYTIYSVFM